MTSPPLKVVGPVAAAQLSSSLASWLASRIFPWRLSVGEASGPLMSSELPLVGAFSRRGRPSVVVDMNGDWVTQRSLLSLLAATRDCWCCHQHCQRHQRCQQVRRLGPRVVRPVTGGHVASWGQATRDDRRSHWHWRRLDHATVLTLTAGCNMGLLVVASSAVNWYGVRTLDVISPVGGWWVSAQRQAIRGRRRSHWHW